MGLYWGLMCGWEPYMEDRSVMRFISVLRIICCLIICWCCWWLPYICKCTHVLVCPQADTFIPFSQGKPWACWVPGQLVAVSVQCFGKMFLSHYSIMLWVVEGTLQFTSLIKYLINVLCCKYTTVKFITIQLGLFLTMHNQYHIKALRSGLLSQYICNATAESVGLALI